MFGAGVLLVPPFAVGCYQADLPLVEPVIPTPVQHDDYSVAKADQIVEVQQEPGNPCGIAAEFQAVGDRHGGATPDGGHASFVLVAK